MKVPINMSFIFWVVLLFVFIAIGLCGSYLLRAVLPANHPLQQKLTDEANFERVHYILKNFKGMVALLLIAYFTVITLVYS